MTEQISALVDNEIQDEHLLDLILEETGTDEHWQRYHLIGDIMRNEHKPGLNFDIAEMVAQALIHEPVYNMQTEIEGEQTQGKTSNRVLSQGSNVVNLFSRGGHYAIAASVAVAVLLGASQFVGNPVATPDATKVFDTAPFSGIASPVSLQIGHTEASYSHNNVQLTENELLAQKKRINAFLQDHQLQQRN